MIANPSNPVLRLDDLEVRYGALAAPAVNRISLDVRRGEILGLVGESGCGKSTAAMAILRLLHAPGRVTNGRVLLDGVDLLAMGKREHRALCWKTISLVPQGAMNALNPVLRVESQIADAIAAHENTRGKGPLTPRINELLALVGLPSRVRRLFPHELSGGMRQRVCIAMAVALRPPVIIADEPTSALDVVVQRVVAQSLLDIKERLGNSMLLIGHDMGLMAQLADRVAVMYAGHLVEIAPVADIFRASRHPYTRQLIESAPAIGQRKPLSVAEGGPPGLDHKPSGCPFAPRCLHAMPRCRAEMPTMTAYGDDWRAACHWSAAQDASTRASA